MTLKVIHGDIFRSQCQTLVNPVNCAGVMGAGLALEFKRRYPSMFREYHALCRQGGFKTGMLWIYKAAEQWVLNFPTKQHWRERSKEEYLHAGLQAFMDLYHREAIESVAFPLLGAQFGGLEPQLSQDVMESYLSRCSIPVEIYIHDAGMLGHMNEDSTTRHVL